MEQIIYCEVRCCGVYISMLIVVFLLIGESIVSIILLVVLKNIYTVGP